jgi:hypothetical protein
VERILFFFDDDRKEKSLNVSSPLYKMYYNTPKILKEYQRQERVVEGWRALRQVAHSMRRDLTLWKKDREAFLTKYEQILKGLLTIHSTKTHRALSIYRTQASTIKRSGNLEYGLDHLATCGPSFS